MNRISFILGTAALLAVTGCAPKDDKVVLQAEATETKDTAPPAAPIPDGVLPLSYMDAAAALAVDDFGKAKVALTTLSKETTGDLQAKAKAAADATDITAMRESFKELSAMASQMKLPDDYAVAFCPMYKGGSKWVQKKETLANPYFGKSMQTCGSWVSN
jgi:hypothetical protein